MTKLRTIACAVAVATLAFTHNAFAKDIVDVAAGNPNFKRSSRRLRLPIWSRP